MQRRITQFTGLFFDDLPYSAETLEARRQIEQALEQACADRSFPEVMRDNCSLEKLALLGGYTVEDAARWGGSAETADRAVLAKGLRRQRWRAYLIAALLMLALSEFVWFVYDGIIGAHETLPVGLLCAALLAAAVWALRRFARVEAAHAQERCATDAYQLLVNYADRYTKRLLNAIALSFAALTLFIGAELSFYFFGNSKAAELAENIFFNIYLAELPLFLVVKNALMVRLTQNRIGLPVKLRMRAHVLGVTLASTLFWGVAALAIALLRDRIAYPANWLLTAGILCAGLMLIYNLTLRRRVTKRNLVFNRRRTALALSLALLLSGVFLMRRDTFYTQPYINALPVVPHPNDPISYDEETGVYTITAAEEDFRILHLTDIHLGGSLFSARQDHKALQACYDEIAHTHPDLVIVTGDLCFPLGIMSMSFNNAAPVYQFASFMRNLGIPWAFTYGNHDTENLASVSAEALDEVYRSLSFKTSGTLLYPYTQPEITGRNNQLIELRNADGTLNTGLFLIDSNAYTGEGINVYDFIHDDQVDWYAGEVQRMADEAGRTVNSLVFFHIPLQEYRTAYELYEKGSDEVTWYFGENGEKMINKVCCSDYPSTLFDRALELGSTTGFFCGHDHYNNMSLGYRGVRLTYGMSIDYLAMPGIENDTAQRGAELITIRADSSWDVEQIPLTSIRS